jgi:hypothetical protein
MVSDTPQPVSRSRRSVTGILVPLAFAVSAHHGMLAGQTPPLAGIPGCVVSGQVRDRRTGQPVRAAAVRLTSASRVIDDRTSYASVIFDKRPRASNGDLTTGSAEDGTFCFRGVGSGQYFLSARKPGFLDADYGSGNYLQAGSVLSVDSAPLRGLAVTLEPMSGIGGRVVDDFGDAVANANVVAVKQVWFHGRRVSMPVQGSQSDERGVYRIGRLTPGVYYVYYVYAQPLPFSAQGMTGAGPARTLIRAYYPAALAAADAALISVPVGEDVSDVDVRMVRARTYHVRGRVDGPPEFRVGGRVRLLPEGEEPMALVFGAGNLNTDGSFDFGGVGPGMYTLAFQSQAGASRCLSSLAKRMCL